MAPFNGAEVGGGQRRSDQDLPPAEATGDQFEQEEGTEIIEEGADDGKTEPVPAAAPRQAPYEHRGDPVKLKEVADIMTDLMSANLTDLRVTKIAIDLNAGQSLKISFGGSGKGKDERGRTLTLHTGDGTWEYSK